MTNNRKENGQAKVCDRIKNRATRGPRGLPGHFYEITAEITTGGSKTDLF